MKWLICLVLFVSCTAPPLRPKNTLKISFSKDPATLDPAKSSDFASSTLICLLYEGLMRCKGGSEVEPGIAEKVEISKDGKTYLFTLRPATWSDGSPLNAHDFERSWKNILSPGFPSPSSYLLFPIKNAREYSLGKSESVGIRAIDETHLKVELEEPTPYFLSLTAFPLLLPSPPKEGIYSGPFEIEKMNVGSEILLKKNNTFWNEKEIKLNHISISILPNEQTALSLFEKGELDILGGPLNPIPHEFIPESKCNIPMNASTFCVLNTKSTPLSDPAVRNAFAQALKNNTSLKKEIEEMGQIPADSILPPALRVSSKPPSTKLSHPVALDRKQKLTLIYKQSPIEKKIALTLQKIWEEELGVQIKLEQLDSTTLIQKLYAKNFDMAITAWIAQVHDPICLLERFNDAHAKKNYSSWEDQTYRTLLERGQIQEAEMVLEEAHPVIPLYHWNFPLLVNSRISIPKATASGGILFEKVSIERESFSPHR